MKTIAIKNVAEAVLWSGEAASIADAIAKARAARAVLRGADLTRAVLRGADLRGADLTRAVLTGAVLTSADFRGADLRGAVLTGAVLTSADFRGADLRGAVLTRADLTGADLTRAVLTRAVLRGADLTGADLRGAVLTRAVLTRADLTGAVLRGADLTRAVLTRADLTRAVLTGADLTGAAWRTSALHMLLDQPGAIRAYKLVTAAYQSPTAATVGGMTLTYHVGQTYTVDDANVDPTELCGRGIHLASMDWILREWTPGMRVLLVEFTAADIARIPFATDGKFRVHRCTVVEEVDLVARGLVDAPPAETPDAADKGQVS